MRTHCNVLLFVLCPIILTRCLCLSMSLSLSSLLYFIDSFFHAAVGLSVFFVPPRSFNHWKHSIVLILNLAISRCCALSFNHLHSSWHRWSSRCKQNHGSEIQEDRKCTPRWAKSGRSHAPLWEHRSAHLSYSALISLCLFLRVMMVLDTNSTVGFPRAEASMFLVILFVSLSVSVHVRQLLQYGTVIFVRICVGNQALTFGLLISGHWGKIFLWYWCPFRVYGRCLILSPSAPRFPSFCACLSRRRLCCSCTHMFACLFLWGHSQVSCAD